MGSYDLKWPWCLGVKLILINDGIATHFKCWCYTPIVVTSETNNARIYEWTDKARVSYLVRRPKPGDTSGEAGREGCEIYVATYSGGYGDSGNSAHASPRFIIMHCSKTMSPDSKSLSRWMRRPVICDNAIFNDITSRDNRSKTLGYTSVFNTATMISFNLPMFDAINLFFLQNIITYCNRLTYVESVSYLGGWGLYFFVKHRNECSVR